MSVEQIQQMLSKQFEQFEKNITSNVREIIADEIKEIKTKVNDIVNDKIPEIKDKMKKVNDKISEIEDNIENDRIDNNEIRQTAEEASETASDNKVRLNKNENEIKLIQLQIGDIGSDKDNTNRETNDKIKQMEIEINQLKVKLANPINEEPREVVNVKVVKKVKEVIPHKIKEKVNEN